MERIAVLAVGPGSPDYITPAVKREVKRCFLLVGGRRNLDLFAGSGCEELEITGKLSPVFSEIRKRRPEGKIGVLVSGDSGLFSILPRLAEEFGRDQLDVYPGISAAQYMLARIGLSWQEAVFISLHGRKGGDPVAEAASGRLAVVFTDSRNSPANLCCSLAEAGLEDKTVWIGEDLSYPQEKISRGKAASFTSWSGSNLNLVVIDGE